MRILQVSGVFCDRTGGGVGDHVCSLGRLLVELGHEVDVITYSRATPKRDHRGLVVHHVPLSSVPGFRYFQWGQDANRFVRRLMSRFDYDIIHAHTTSMAFPLYYESSEPLVITSHGTSVDPVHGVLKRPVLARIERSYYKKAARVVAVSLSVKNELIRTGLPESLLTVIPNGTDSMRFHTAGSKESARALVGLRTNEIAVLFVGANTERQGLRIILDAIEKTLKQKVGPFRFFVVGTGPLRSRLQRLAARLPQ